MHKIYDHLKKGPNSKGGRKCVFIENVSNLVRCVLKLRKYQKSPNSATLLCEENQSFSHLKNILYL